MNKKDIDLLSEQYSLINEYSLDDSTEAEKRYGEHLDTLDQARKIVDELKEGSDIFFDKNPLTGELWDEISEEELITMAIATGLELGIITTNIK